MSKIWLWVGVILVAFFAIWSGLAPIAQQTVDGTKWLIFAGGLFVALFLILVGIGPAVKK